MLLLLEVLELAAAAAFIVGQKKNMFLKKNRISNKQTNITMTLPLGD